MCHRSHKDTPGPLLTAEPGAVQWWVSHWGVGMASGRSLARSRTQRNRFGALVPLAVVVSFAVAGPVGLAGASTRQGAGPAVPSSCTNTNAITLGDPATSGSITAPAQVDCYTFSRTSECGHIKFGKTALAGSITLAGNVDCYRFDAASFDRMRLRVLTTGGALQANADIMNPNGTTACGPSTELEQTCKLLGGTGTYTIFVRDLVGPNTGSYNIYLQRLNTPLLCVPILFGDPAVAGSITVPADADCYTFDSTFQQVFQVEVIATGGTLQPNAEVFSPNGSTLCGPSTDDVLTCKSVAAGSHSVLIRALGGAGTGTYTISVKQL